jgi:geranylgeranyl transferase type-2 subunit beta
MLRRLDWIDHEALARFIQMCQDSEDGGIADKPGNQPDVYHTFFGITGLSLMGKGPVALGAIDPTYALPPGVLERRGISA